MNKKIEIARVIATVFDNTKLCAVDMQSLINRDNADTFFNSDRQENGWVQNLDGLKEFYDDIHPNTVFIFRFPGKDFAFSDFITLFTLIGAVKKNHEVRFVRHKKIDERKYRNYTKFENIDNIDYMDELTKDALRLGWLYDTYSQELKLKAYMEAQKYMPFPSEINIIHE